MIQEIKDEIIEGSPRYNVTDNEDGTKNIELANNVLQAGTPLNKATLENLQGDLYTVDRYNAISPIVSEETDLMHPLESTTYMWESDSLTKTHCYSKDSVFGDAVIETSGTYSTTYLPRYSLTEKTSSYWRSASGGEQWWKITFKKPIQIHNIYVNNTSDCVIQGRVDTNSEWVNLTDILSGANAEYVLQNQNKYLEYRVYWENITTSYCYLYRFNILSLYVPRYILESNIPLSSYEEGKIANVCFESKINVASNYIEEEFTSPVQPVFTSDTVQNEYGNWEVKSGKLDSTTYSAFDSSSSTYKQLGELGTNETSYIQIGNQATCGENTWAIRPTTINVTYSRATLEGIMGFDYKEKRWVLLSSTSHSSEAAISTATYTFTDTRYFSAFRLVVSRKSSSYDEAYIYDFKISSGYIRYGIAIPDEEKMFQNLYLKFGALTPQKINDVLHSGINYQLIYKNGKWVKSESNTLVEKRELYSYYREELKGVAKYILLKATSGTSLYMAFPGDSSLSLSSSNYTVSLSDDGSYTIYAYSGTNLTGYTCLIFY